MNPQLNPWWKDNRGWIFLIAAICTFGLIELRLFSLQLMNQPDFIKIAATNRVRAEVIEPARGRILDNNKRLLVENRPSYILYALPWTVRDNPETIISLASVLKMDSKQIKNRLGVHGWNTFYPTPVKRDLEFGTVAYLEVTKRDYPGISFSLEVKRSYPRPETVHLLGYVGERSLEESRRAGGRFGLIGKRGVELIYEEWLKGEPGIQYHQVDVAGRITGLLDDPAPVEPKPGWDLQLNVDASLQEYAYELMDGRAGAVVALDPRNGNVLVKLSLPDYDPSLFAGFMPEKVWQGLVSDPGHPLLNRAIQGLYPPGSTFKMAILAAALEEGIVDDKFKVTCRGGLQLGRRFFKCWKHGGHGTVDKLKAIQQSCDVFFYTLGLRLGAEKMAEYCNIFGFGKRTGIDYDSEQPGIIPHPDYLDKKYGKGKWTRGQLANIAIGQGDVVLTPVQLAVFAAAIATGKIVKPRLGNKLINPSTGEIREIPSDIKPVELEQSTINVLREGMRMVVNEAGGTAYWLRRSDIELCGKTGTSQNPHGEDHGLFVGFAPFDRPLIAVAVIVEHGEHGSTSAAPVACKLMTRYIKDLYPGPEPRPVIKTKPQPETESEIAEVDTVVG